MQPMAHAAFWIVAGYGGSQILRLGCNVVLSRLLSPAYFGAMALVVVMLMGLEMLSDLGIGVSVIQNPRGDDESFLNTAWTLQILRGVVILLITLLMAWPVALFYDQPHLVWLVPGLGACSAISGFNSTTLFTSKRHLLLKSLTLFELLAQFVGIVVTVIWAWLFPSLLALLGGAMFAAIFKAVGSHVLLHGRRNHWQWDPRDRGADHVRQVDHGLLVSDVFSHTAGPSDPGQINIQCAVRRLQCRGESDRRSANAAPRACLGSGFAYSFEAFARLWRQSRGSAAANPRGDAGRWNRYGVGGICRGRLVFRITLRFTLSNGGTHRASANDNRLVRESRRHPRAGTDFAGRLASTAIAGIVRFVTTFAASITGFYLADIWGFILGLALGAACGQITLLVSLARHRINLYDQDVLYSLLLFGLCALAWPFRQPNVRLHGFSLTALIPQMFVLATCLWAGNKMLRLAQMRRAASVAVQSDPLPWEATAI